MILTKPVGLQARSIVESNARLNIWDGAVRSGKTIASILRWLHFIITGPEGELLMAGRTERTLKRNVLDPIAGILGDDDIKVRSGAGEARILGRRIYLAGANDERSETKLRGLTLAGAYGDELTTWSPNFFGMLLSRLSITDARFFGTTNPDNPNHWLKRDYLDRAELDLKRFQFRLDDNSNLDPAFIANLKAENVGVYYRRMILGEWVQAEGAIYEWKESIVVEQLPPIEQWLCIGCDYGRVNPFVALLLALGADGRTYVVSELRWDSRKERRQKSDAEYSVALQGWLRSFESEGAKPEWIFVDPSANSFMTQLYRDGVEGVRPADNRVDDGIRVVATAMSQDRLRIHSSCRDLIAEFPNYSWDEKAAERGEDRPLKQHDHSVDALRYALMGTRHLWSRTELRNLPDH